MVADISRWKDGLSRLFVYAQPFRSVDLIVRGEASGWWHPGAMGPGVGRVSCRAPVNGAEESRPIRRPSVSLQTKRPRLGGNRWSRARKSGSFLNLLGWSFVVMAPPISLHTLSSGAAHSAISCPVHCFRRIRLIVEGVPMGLEFLTLIEPCLGRAICPRHLEHRAGRSARR